MDKKEVEVDMLKEQYRWFLYALAVSFGWSATMLVKIKDTGDWDYIGFAISGAIVSCVLLFMVFKTSKKILKLVGK